MEISLPILDWIREFFLKLGLLGSILVPMGITAICVALYFAISRTKTTRKLEKTTPIHETAETEGMKLHGLSDEQLEILGLMRSRRPEVRPTLNEGNGHADLEDRLISALASAPWEVKEGSEIALEKSDSNKWGIATKKIAFVLGKNGEAKSDEQTTPVGNSAPEEPEPPPPIEEEEESAEVV